MIYKDTRSNYCSVLGKKVGTDYEIRDCNIETTMRAIDTIDYKMQYFRNSNLKDNTRKKETEKEEF